MTTLFPSQNRSSQFLYERQDEATAALFSYELPFSNDADQEELAGFTARGERLRG